MIRFKSRSLINYLFNDKKYKKDMVTNFNSDHLYTLISVYVNGNGDQKYNSRYYKSPEMYQEFIIQLIKTNKLKPNIKHLCHPKLINSETANGKEQLILFLLKYVKPTLLLLEKMCLNGSYYIIKKILEQKIIPTSECFKHVLKNTEYDLTYEDNSWFFGDMDKRLHVNSHYNTKRWKLELLIMYQYYPTLDDLELMKKYGIELRDMFRFEDLY